jgi:hypothetical protein
MSNKTLGQFADELSDDREEIRRLQTKLDDAKRAFATKQESALERMTEEGTIKVTGTKATITVSIQTVANIKDWEKYYRYIKQHNAFHLLERRPASKAWREEVEIRRGKPVPGSEGFEKRTLNLRNV